MTQAEFDAKYPRLFVRESIVRMSAQVAALVYLHTGHRRGLVTWATEEMPEQLDQLREATR